MILNKFIVESKSSNDLLPKKQNIIDVIVIQCHSFLVSQQSNFHKKFKQCIFINFIQLKSLDIDLASHFQKYQKPYHLIKIKTNKSELCIVIAIYILLSKLNNNEHYIEYCFRRSFTFTLLHSTHFAFIFFKQLHVIIYSIEKSGQKLGMGTPGGRGAVPGGTIPGGAIPGGAIPGGPIPGGPIGRIPGGIGPIGPIGAHGPHRSHWAHWRSHSWHWRSHSWWSTHSLKLVKIRFHCKF